MSARLTADVRVRALIRRVHAVGGSAMVLARGDPQAGAILILALERGGNPHFFERGIGPMGEPQLVESGPKRLADEGEVAAYWRRRRDRDPDLWVVELDVAEAERFAAETISLG